MVHVDDKTYPILKEQNPQGMYTNANKPPNTPLGLFFAALRNHMALRNDKGEGISYPSYIELALTLLGEDNASRCSDTMRYKRKNGDARYIEFCERIVNRCTGRAKLYYQSDAAYDEPYPGTNFASVYATENRAGRMPRAKYDRYVADFVYSLDTYAMTERNVSWRSLINNESELGERIRNHPITGNDEFSLAMCHLYEQTYGKPDETVATPGIDLKNCIGFTRARGTSASFEALKVILVGILFGPLGLSLYTSISKTPPLLGGSYRRELVGFKLTQIEPEVKGIKSQQFADDTEVVLSGKGPKRKGYFVPQFPVGQLSAVSSPHAFIEPIVENNRTLGWTLRDRADKTRPTHGTAVFCARDESVHELVDASPELKLEDDDEIWLVLKRTHQQDGHPHDVTPHSLYGVRIRFNEIVRWVYDRVGAAEEMPNADDMPADHVPPQQRTGFRLHSLNQDDALYEFSFEDDGSGDGFELPIGRSNLISDFGCEIAGASVISRGHATFFLYETDDGIKQVFLCDGITTNSDTTNGTEIIRGGTSYKIGGTHEQKSLPLNDGDVIYFPSRAAAVAKFSFAYL